MLSKRAVAQDLAVGDAVERHAARQAEILHLRSRAARLRVSRSTTSSSTACIEAARSMCFCSSSDSGSRGGAAEQRVEALVRHRQPGAIVEIIEIEPERAVGLEVDEVVADRAAHSAASP